jgi:hypothetical protein
MKLPISITLGIIAGAILCLSWFLLAKSLGFYSIDVYIYVYGVKLALILIGVFLSVYLVKRNNHGFLEFKSALQTGMLYCLVLAVIVSLFNYIYYTFITPDTVDYFVAEAKKYGETTLKLEGEQLQKLMDAERSRLGSFTVIPPILFWGLVISLLAGLIFQKKDPHKFSAN